MTSKTPLKPLLNYINGRKGSIRLISWSYQGLVSLFNGISTFVGYLIPDIGIMVRVFANGPGDLGSIPGRFIPKTQKMVLDAILLNTQHYKVRI